MKDENDGQGLDKAFNVTVWLVSLMEWLVLLCLLMELLARAETSVLLNLYSQTGETMEPGGFWGTVQGFFLIVLYVIIIGYILDMASAIPWLTKTTPPSAIERMNKTNQKRKNNI